MSVRLARTYPTAADAARVAAAVAADNPPHVRLAVRDRELAIELDDAAPGSARATLDDLVACLTVAERAALAARPAPADPR